MNEESPCFGCIWYRQGIDKDSRISCHVRRTHIENICPCRECLVKIMCTAKGDCKEFVGFVSYWRKVKGYGYG
jgi:hypothetical protein